MMKFIKSVSSPTAVLTIAIVLLSKTDLLVMGQTLNVQIPPYLLNNSNDAVNDIIVPSSNTFDSIQYFMFTPSNPMVACHIEPNPEDFDLCPFDSSYGTKFLIHGFNASVNPESIFCQIKGKLLEVDKYNIVILNYTAYSYPPYSMAVFNSYHIGLKVADMIKFLIDYARVNPQDVHLIGHSLGGQLAGVIGRNVPNLGRITALDPAGPFFSLNPHQLRPTDANFVDVIHSSNYLTGLGFGTHKALGDVDFYPNGGEIQPECEMGDTFIDRNGTPLLIISFIGKAICNHVRSLHYFLHSVEKCEYLATQCSSYNSYKLGGCSSNSRPTDRMGLYSKKIAGLEQHTKFFLETGPSATCCENT